MNTNSGISKTEMYYYEGLLSCKYKGLGFVIKIFVLAFIGQMYFCILRQAQDDKTVIIASDSVAICPFDSQITSVVNALAVVLLFLRKQESIILDIIN